MENSKSTYAHNTNNNISQLKLTIVDNGFVNPKAKNAVYPIPTEIYNKKTLDALNLLNIDHYLGILGGFTKHVLIIDRLLRNGKSFDINLYDISIDQINVSKKVFKEYKEIQENGLKKEDIRRSLYNWLLSPYNIKDIYGEIKFIYDDIRNAIKSADKEGTYFIHLSNAFPFSLKIDGEWVDLVIYYNNASFSSSVELLRDIAINEKIKPGSLIFVASVADLISEAGIAMLNAYSKVVILRKEKNVNENTWTEYLRNGDKKEMYYYLGTYNETASKTVSELMSVINPLNGSFDRPFSVYHYFIDENNYKTEHYTKNKMLRK